MAAKYVNYLTYKTMGGTLGSIEYGMATSLGASTDQLISGAVKLSGGKLVNTSATNTLTTNATKSASQITQATLAGIGAPQGPTQPKTIMDFTPHQGQVGGATNTINGQPIPTSGTNDPSMFTIPQGDGLTVAQRSAKYNAPPTNLQASAAATAGGGSGGGSMGSGGSLDAIAQAFNDALRVGSKQDQANQQQALATSLQANQIAAQNNKALQDILAASTQQAAQSNEILQKTLAGLNSGSKGAQTGLEAVDVSEQMAAQDSKRRDLRRTSAADTKEAGLLSQKALLSKPTLLGL